MNDPSQPSTDYKPEEGAEVRPAARYAVAPGGLEALAHDTPETPYRSLSLLAVAALVLAVAYSFIVVLGGIMAFWDRAAWVLILGTILVPLLSIPVALKFDIREPLGVLRFAGLALAGFYAVPVGVGGLIAFPSHAPWLMPWWTLLIPLLAAGCGLAARLRIDASEDTLSGKPLALYAIGLSVFFALCYSAFYLATFLAVRQQAGQFADDWIEKLQKGDLERAFVLTIPPTYRSGKDALPRETIELNYSEGPQGYANFGQRQCVWLLRGSTKANVERISVGDLSFEGGGYKVQLNYRVTTPYWSFPLEMTVQGIESQKDEYKGRRWFVNGEVTGVRKYDVTFTEEGKRLLTLRTEGHEYAEQWLKKLWNDENTAWLETRPADERAKDIQLGTLAAATGPGLRAAQEKRTEFFQGALVNRDEKLFWAPARVRATIVDRMLSIFLPGSDKSLMLQLRDLKQSAPAWSEEDGRLRFSYEGDATIEKLPVTVDTTEGQQIGYTKVRVEMRLLVSCPSAALKEGKPEWRVDGVELIRARRVEEAAAKPGKTQRK